MSTFKTIQTAITIAEVAWGAWFAISLYGQIKYNRGKRDAFNQFGSEMEKLKKDLEMMKGQKQKERAEA